MEAGLAKVVKPVAISARNILTCGSRSSTSRWVDRATVRGGRGALATSSTTRRSWRAGGRTASHLVDPRTGEPVESPVRSATAVTASAVEAEAAAKAMLLSGVDSLAWAEEQSWVRAGLVVWWDGSVSPPRAWSWRHESDLDAGAGLGCRRLRAALGGDGLGAAPRQQGARPLGIGRDLTWVHESLSLAAVASTAVHMVSLWLEEFIDFDLRHLLIPGASTFRPVPVALGVVAFWALAVITPSFYLRHKIGQRAWRIALRHVRLLPGGGPPWDHRRYRHRATRHGGPLRHHSDRSAWANRAPAGQGGASSSRREAVGEAAPASRLRRAVQPTQPAKPRIPPELLERSSVTAPDEAPATDAPPDRPIPPYPTRVARALAGEGVGRPMSPGSGA